MDNGKEDLVVLLLEQRQVADAVKVCQEETGASPWEAKQMVRELARKHGFTDGRRREMISALLVGSAGVLGVLLGF